MLTPKALHGFARSHPGVILGMQLPKLEHLSVADLPTLFFVLAFLFKNRCWGGVDAKTTIGCAGCKRAYDHFSVLQNIGERSMIWSTTDIVAHTQSFLFAALGSEFLEEFEISSGTRFFDSSCKLRPPFISKTQQLNKVNGSRAFRGVGRAQSTNHGAFGYSASQSTTVPGFQRQVQNRGNPFGAQEACLNFNLRTHCKVTPCKWKHVCWNCNSSNKTMDECKCGSVRPLPRWAMQRN